MAAAAEDFLEDREDRAVGGVAEEEPQAPLEIWREKNQ